MFISQGRPDEDLPRRDLERVIETMLRSQNLEICASLASPAL